MATVFLSYAHEDADCARRLADALNRLGYSVWWDRDLHGGSRYATEIARALSDADAIVVLWSNASIESVWVQDEAAEGRDTARLVPVLISDVRPPLGFRQFHSIDLRSIKLGEPLDVNELLRAIRKLAVPDVRSAPNLIVAGPTSKKSVCVLPFVNMSGEPEQEYFSDGISEDIITDLSKVSAVEVIARNTAFSFKGQRTDAREIARFVGASHVLEGSVRKSGTRVRIAAQLVEGSDGKQIWAERYDRELTDIFEIQDELSRAIIESLKVKLQPEEQHALSDRGTGNVEAYNLYLMAREQWVSGSYGSVRRDQAIVRICSQATLIDPNYAEAWALMAIAQTELRFWHGRDEDARQAAERALALKPTLAEPHCVTARYLEDEGNHQKALAEVQEALRLSPDSWEVNREAARVIFRQGRLEESIPYFEKAASLVSSDWHNPAMLFVCYRKLGDEPNLRRTMKMVLDRVDAALMKEPTNGSAIAMKVAALAYFGEEERAREWVQRGLLLDPDNLSMLYNLACSVVMELNDREQALTILEPFMERTMSAAHLRHMDVDPDMDPIRQDERFKAMLARARTRLHVDP